MPANRELELRMLQDTADTIDALGTRLRESSAIDVKAAQQEYEHRLEIYKKQLRAFNAQFPGDKDTKYFEASYYGYRAMLKVFGQGFLRRAAQDQHLHGAIKVAAAVVAKQQDRTRALEAIALLDKAIGVCDTPGIRYIKAEICWYALKDKDAALGEVAHIITHHDDDEIYIEARKLKDEIETPRKQECFVTTAAFGSALAPEVEILRAYRDSVMSTTRPGRAFIRCYYAASPPLARSIQSRPMLRAAARIMLYPVIAWARCARYDQ